MSSKAFARGGHFSIPATGNAHASGLPGAAKMISIAEMCSPPPRHMPLAVIIPTDADVYWLQISV
jgi:hypothetical protein